MRNRQSQRGEVILEMAVITPALLLLVVGAMDVSRAFRTAMVTASASREGIHYASRNTTTSDDIAGIQNAAKADASNMQGLNVVASHYCTCSLGGTEAPCNSTCTGLMRYVKVRSTYAFTPMLKIPGLA